MLNLLSNLYQNLKTADQKIRNEFSSLHYQKHNVARLSHLESLGLDLSNKTVFEYGAGIGDHSYYYLIKNCTVTASDARAELVDFIKKRWGIESIKIDIEKDIEKIKKLPHYDIIHCYGILYHINNPQEFLSALKDKCSLLLLETSVTTDEKKDGIYLTDENRLSLSQSVSGKGCRPTRKWILNQLKSIFPYVYLPITQPNHIEFPKDWSKHSEDNAIKRAVFIGSASPISSDKLVDYLPIRYK